MELTEYMQFAIALVFVLALIGIAAWLFRRGTSRGKSSNGWFSAKPHRLGIVGASHIDSRRRLILVRRDDVEHLLMIGGPVDIVVETGIAPCMDDGAAGPDDGPGRKEPALSGTGKDRQSATAPKPLEVPARAGDAPQPSKFDPATRINTIFQAAMQRASGA